MTKKTRCRAVDEFFVGGLCQRGVECAEGAFATFVVLYRVDRGDPLLDRGIAKFVDEVEEVLVEFGGEIFDILIGVDERGDQAPGFVRDLREVG